MKKIIYLLALFFVMGNVLAIEGVNPGSYEVDFESELEGDFVFDFYMDDKEDVYAQGALGDYVELDKHEILGRESVVVSLKLPEVLDVHEFIASTAAEFGVNNIWVVAGDVRGLIKVNVEYPEMFVGLDFSVPSVNVGEDIEVGLKVLNLGKKKAYFKGSVEVYFEDEIIEEFSLNSDEINVSGEKDFDFLLDGGDYSAGDYLVVARVDYGRGLIVEENVFRVGEFDLIILNYTREVGDGIEKFEIEIESLWNSRMSEVFGEVRVVGGNGEVSDVLIDRSGGFDSSIISLGAWERGVLVGFFDARGLEGEVVMSVDVHYDGDVVSDVVSINVVKGISLWFWFGGVLFLVALGFFGWKFFWGLE